VLFIAFVTIIIIAVLWWLLVTTEGVYLGRRVVIWLYDLYADRYDNIKNNEPKYEQLLLTDPIMGMIAPHISPLVLDVATGTGRLPLALIDHPVFQGRIIAVDLSYKMLKKAAQKIAQDGRVSLLHCPAETLPFPDDTFDVVTCLEALEFMTNPRVVIAEIVRVLRPGGLLLTTNRIATRLMPGKTFSNEDLAAMLAEHGIEDVIMEAWQVDYHRVWGMKAGDSPATGARRLAEVLNNPPEPDKNGIIDLLRLK
jgi:SAM-dependent methyltransferase